MNKVTLHKVAVDHDHAKVSENEMEVVSIHLNPTTVAAFPANDISDDGKTTYKDRYSPFIGLTPSTDAERIEKLEADLADRDARIAEFESQQNGINPDSDYQDPNAPHMPAIKQEQSAEPELIG